MPFQNRVTPFGDIVALPGRGLLMGNRGVLHDETQRIVRSSQTRRWIACRTEFRGRHRAIFQPRRWTELFFLDETTALSAGHRPCAECRHYDYRRFRDIWMQCIGGLASADRMDATLHAERIRDRKKRTYRDAMARLPNGTYVDVAGGAWLVWGDTLFRWSDSGYVARMPRPGGEAEILTPQSIVSILTAGYVPAVHPSLFEQVPRS